MAKTTSPQGKQESTTDAATMEASPGVERNAGATAGTAAAAQATTAQATTAQAGAIELLKQDHRKVEGLFEQFEQSDDEGQKQSLVERICEELILHMHLEESLFYPACRKAGVESDTMDEAQVEHDGAKTLLNDLLDSKAGDGFWEAKVSVLKEMIEQHVAEEEKPKDGAFAQALAHGIDDSGLASWLTTRKQELQRRAAGKQPIRAISINPKEDSMPRYGYAERDDRGRFTSDDDRGYGRSRYGDDDERYGNGGRGRGHGGWYGDPEGHSEAARSRSGEGRYSGRSRDDDRYGDGGRYRDDDRYGDSERYGNGGRYDDRAGRDRDERGRFMSDDDDRRSGGSNRDRDERGRFTSDDDDRRSGANYRDRDERGRFASDDDRGYGSRSRDDDDDRYGSGRGHGGWFGDSEGHSRAARSRGDDDRRSSSSRRDDDDDRRSGNGGRGGWFGDPRGHAEASRRGWQHRR